MQKISIKRVFILLFIFICPVAIFAQEVLTPLQTNIQLKSAWESYKIKKNTKGTKDGAVELPFFDDFSGEDIYPNHELWEDNCLYINREMASNPPTIGVATLDAINAKGEVYNVASPPANTGDTLTSRPIKLNNSFQDVYLSFMYQPQGICDAPEFEDSLVVEFYSPQTDEWTVQWGIHGSENHEFRNVILPVSGDEYLQDGFRFRFLNFVSLSSDYKPSLVGNVDHWHIDYILLNKNRNNKDTIFKDIAYNQPMQSILKEYANIPWSHFKKVGNSVLKEQLTVSIKNNENVRRGINQFNFFIEDMSTGEKTPLDVGGGIPATLNANETQTISKDNSFSISKNGLDSTDFILSSSFIADSDDPKINNTISYVQRFHNYYAYDDGSAEVGYGLTGEGSKYSYIAYLYETYVEDSLQAVQIYFNQTLDNASKNPFYLNIWSDDGNAPGEELYSGYISPGDWDYIERINAFRIFRLEEPLILNGKFYIGIQQMTEDMLNIGLDLNTQVENKIFYNINDEWRNSKVKGALMIRPVFGKPVPENIVSDIEQDNDKNLMQLNIYPNPAKSFFVVDCQVNNNEIDIEIYNQTGKLIFNTSYYNNQIKINTRDWNQGIYFIRLKNKTTIIETKRIVLIK